MNDAQLLAIVTAILVKGRGPIGQSGGTVYPSRQDILKSAVREAKEIIRAAEQS